MADPATVAALARLRQLQALAAAEQTAEAEAAQARRDNAPRGIAAIPSNVGGFFGQLVPGFERGVESLPGQLSGLSAAVQSALGNEDAAAAAQRKAAIQGALVEDLFGGPGEDANAGEQFGFMVGGTLGEMLPAAGAGLVGTGAKILGATPRVAAAVGGIGTAGAMYGQNVGRNIQSQLDMRGMDTDLEVGNAAAAAVGQTGIDLVLGRFLRGDDVFNSVVGDTVLRTGLTRGALQGATRGAAEEGLAEVGQTALDRAQLGIDLLSEAALNEYGQAFVSGAAVGGLLGGVTGGAAGYSDRRQQERETAEAERRLAVLDAEDAEMAAYAGLGSLANVDPAAGPMLALPSPSMIGTARQEPPTGTDFFVGPDATVRPAGGIAAAVAPPTALTDFQADRAQLLADLDAQRAQIQQQRDIEMAARQGTDFRLQRDVEAILQAQRDAEAADRARKQAALDQRKTQQTFTQVDDVRRRAAALNDPDRVDFVNRSVIAARRDRTFYDDPKSPFDTDLVLTNRGKPDTAIDVLGPGKAKDSVLVRDRETGKDREVPRSRIGVVTRPRPLDPETPLRQATAASVIPDDLARRDQQVAKDLRLAQLDAALDAQRGTPTNPDAKPLPYRTVRDRDLRDVVTSGNTAAPSAPAAGVGSPLPPAVDTSPVAPGEPTASTQFNLPIDLPTATRPVQPDLGLTPDATASTLGVPSPAIPPVSATGATASVPDTSPTLPSPEPTPSSDQQDLPLPPPALPPVTPAVDQVQRMLRGDIPPPPGPPPPPPAKAPPPPPKAAVPAPEPEPEPTDVQADFDALAAKKTRVRSTRKVRTDTAPNTPDEDAVFNVDNLDAALDAVIQRNAAPGYAEIATKVRDKVRALEAQGFKFNFAVVQKRRPRGMPKTATGLMRADRVGAGSTVISTFVTGSASGNTRDAPMDRSVLHEAIHAVTFLELRAGNQGADPVLAQTSQRLRNVYAAFNAYRRRRLAENASGARPLTDDERYTFNYTNITALPDEILTWGMASAPVQRVLESIPYQGSNLWTDFVAAVRRLLGLLPQRDTVLSEVLRVMDTSLGTPAETLAKVISQTFGEGLSGQTTETETRTINRIAEQARAFGAARGVRVEIQPGPGPSPKIEITDFYNDSPGNGRGSEVLREVIRLATEADLPIVLRPESPRNSEYYGRFGFERASQTPGYTNLPGFMVWQPPFNMDAYLDERPNRTIAGSPARVDSLLSQYDSWSGKTKGMATSMSPDDFLALTLPSAQRARVEGEAGPLDLKRLADETQSPFLIVETQPDGSLQVLGHEGRHRAVAMRDAGVTEMPVVLDFGPEPRQIRTDVDSFTLLPQRGVDTGARVETGPAIPITATRRDDLTAPAETAFAVFESGAPLTDERAFLKAMTPDQLDQQLAAVGVARGDTTWNQVKGAMFDGADDADTVMAVQRLMRARADRGRSANGAPPAGPKAAAKTPDVATDPTAVSDLAAAMAQDKFKAELTKALKNELRQMGFGGRIADALAVDLTQGDPAAKLAKDGKTIVFSMNLANNATDVAGAVQALRPYLTAGVVDFAQRNGLMTPAETKALLDYAKATVLPGSAQTLYERAAQINDDGDVDAAAVAFTAEYLARLDPGSRDPRARATRPPKPAVDASAGLFDRMAAVGRAFISSLRTGYSPDAARMVVSRLAKADAAARVRGRFTAPVEFTGYLASQPTIVAMGRDLRQRLDAMGLSDVGLRLTDVIMKPGEKGKPWVEAPDAQGSYFARTITVSLAHIDPSAPASENLDRLIRVVDHEAIHALRAVGVWSPQQWKGLASFVRTATDPATGETFFAKAKRELGASFQGMDEPTRDDILTEEAVAHAFATNFDAGLLRPLAPRAALDRVLQFFTGLGQSLYQNGVVSPDQILANGSATFAAVRAGELAKRRRDLMTGSPADVSMRFALTPRPNAKSNPAQDPDLADLLARSRVRNPFSDWATAKDVASALGLHKEREVPLSDRIPLVSRFFNPLADLIGHDQFKLAKGLTDGVIADIDILATSLGQRMSKLIGKNAKLRDATTAYFLTRGANPAVAIIEDESGAKVPNPAYISNEELRDLAVRAKSLVDQVGQLTVDAGLLAPERYASWRGQYLPNLTTETQGVYNISRLVLSDLSYTKERRTPTESEQVARGYIDDPVIRLTTYLAKAGRDLAISRMYDAIIEMSDSQPGGQKWVLNSQNLVPWRGKRWSVLAVEAELDAMNTRRRDALEMTKGEPDPKREQQVAILNEHIRTGRLALMTNPAWLEARRTTLAEIAQSLGVDPAGGAAALQNASYDAVEATFNRAVARANIGADTVADTVTGRVEGAARDALATLAEPIYQQYKLVPNVERFGALRGTYVKQEIFDIINATGAVTANLAQDANDGTARAAALGVERLTQFFKKAKTVYNPATHGVNFIGNLLNFQMLGGADPVSAGIYALKAAAQIKAGTGPAYDVARKYGSARTGLSTSDLNALTRADRYADLLQEVDLSDLSDDLVRRDPWKAMMALTGKISAIAAATDQKVSDLYQLGDTLFKVAKIQMDMDRGLTPEEGFLNAQDVFLDYTIVPPFIRLARAMPFGSPFISWSYMMMGQMVNKLSSSTVVKRNADGSEIKVPNVVFMAPWIGIAGALNAAAYAALGFEDEEDQEYLKTGLPSFAKSGTGLLFLGLDSSGRPQFADVLKYTAFGTPVRAAEAALTTKTQGSRPVGVSAIFKEFGFASDPASQLASVFVLDRDPSTGRPVTKMGMTGTEAGMAMVAAAWDIMMPPLTTGIFSGENPILGAYGLASGLADRDSPSAGYEGNRPALTFGQKIAKLAGWSTYVTDPMPAMKRAVEEATRVRAAVSSEVRAIQRDPALTDEEKEARIRGNLGERWLRMYEREQEYKTRFAEMDDFYARYRAQVVAKGLPDPYAEDKQTIADQREKLATKDLEKYVRDAVSQRGQ